MASASVMIADGGGGKDYSGQHIPMSDVVGENKLDKDALIEKYGEYILYETEIDTADLEERINNLKEKVAKTAEKIGSDMQNIQKEQRKTGSKTVDDENNNAIMSEIFGTVSDLTSTLGLSCMQQFGSMVAQAACNAGDAFAISYLNQMFADCKDYNAVIRDLKKGIKLKLLQAKADDINEKSLVRERSGPTLITCPSDQWLYDYSYNSDGIWKYEVHYDFIGLSEDGFSNKFNQTIKKHEYINWWGWIKSTWKPFTIFDDDIKELTDKLGRLGYSVPWKEDRIRGEVD